MSVRRSAMLLLLVVSLGGRSGAAGDVRAATVAAAIASQDQWRTARLSGARTAIAAATVRSKLLFAAGRKRFTGRFHQLSAVVGTYDDADGGWSTAPLSVGRWVGAAAVVGTEALIAGSHTGTMYAPLTLSAAADVYDSGEQ